MAAISGYDDVSIFTPEGRVKALDYTQHTVELGNTAVGLCNKKIGILVAHTGTINKLGYPAKKLYKINDSCGFTFSGITNDGLSIVEHLQNESIWLEIYLGKKKTIEMFDEISVDASLRTMRNNNRMFGVGGIMLCEGREGVEIIKFKPSGIVKYVFAASIGARSQVATTILEQHVDRFNEMDRNALIEIGIEAVKNANSSETICVENLEIIVLENGKVDFLKEETM